MLWLIYDNDTAAIVGNGAGSVAPQSGDFPGSRRVFLGANADPATYRMNATRDGVELIPVEE